MSRLAVFILTALPLLAQTPTIEARIDALLKQMTVEEKVGQMTQVAIDVVTANGAAALINSIPPNSKRHPKYKVGSILNVNGEAYTVQHWRQVINAIQDSAAKTRLKIPLIHGIDSVHGANYTHDATLFPQAY